MSLSSDLISQFVKTTKDDSKVSNETTVYGTIVYDGKPYVKLDGSDMLTPISTTTDVKDGERVTVMIKNHTAIVTGNISSPSASTKAVKEIGSKISEFEIVMAYKVTTEDLEAAYATIDSLRAKLAVITTLDAVYADIDELQAKFAELDYVDANEIEALTANIEKIQAHFGDFTDISTDDLEALNADIASLKGYTADFTYVSAEILNAFKANIKELNTTKLSAEEADMRYVNIDFANIDQAWFDKFYAESGIIKNVTISEGVVVKELVGVTIKGDLIEAGTLKADRLVVLGSDGNYYKLSTDFTAMPGVEPVEEDAIHGSVLIAESITAEKISVDDLVAFNATIGGFNISENAIYSGVKSDVNNTTMGIYLDNDGQIAFGDGNNYVKYYKDGDQYKLDISAGSIRLSSSDITIQETIDEMNFALDEKSDKEEVPLLPEVVNNNTPSVTTNNTFENGIKNIRIFGQTIQDGTPTPDTPIEPSCVCANGTVSLLVKNKNYFDISKHGPFISKGTINEKFANGVDAQGQNGSTTELSTTNGSLYFGYSSDAERIPLVAGRTVTVSADVTVLSNQISAKTFRLFLYSKAANVYTSADTIIPEIGVRSRCSWTLSVPDGGEYYIQLRLAACRMRISHIQIEDGSEATAYEACTYQTMSISTDSGLHGTKIATNPTYTEFDGTGWVCDEIDLSRGVRIQRIGAKTLESTDSWSKAGTTGTTERFMLAVNWLPCTPICNAIPGIESANSSLGWSGTDTVVTITDDDDRQLCIYRLSVQVPEVTSLSTFKSWLNARNAAGNPIVVWYALAEPIETPLTEEEIAAFTAMTTGAGTLFISTDEANLSVEVADYATSTNVDDLQKIITEQSTIIVNNNEQILMTALEKYELKDDADTFKTTVTSQIEQVPDQINMRFDTVTEEVSNLNEDIQSKFTELHKHISFSENGITISAGPNQMKLRIDNNLITFYKGDVDETDLTKNRFGWWDGVNFHTGNIVVDTTERAQFGNFAFVPRTDGSLSFFKVGG